MTETANIHGTDDGNLTVVLPKKIPDTSIKDTWGYTYFVKRGGLIKIGHTGAPKRRIGHYGPRADVLAIIPNTIIDEPTAHNKFAHLRVKSEWFRPAPDLLDFIKWAKIQAKAIPERERVNNTEFDEISAGLHAMRGIFKADTPKGHACSNLIQQIKNYRAAEGNMKASLAKQIHQQLDRLK